MLNYMRSEAYQLRRNRSFLACLIVMTAGILAIIGIMKYIDSLAAYRLSLHISALYTSISFMHTFVIVVAGSLENNEYQRHHTMKNSVAFGFSRTNIYLGKFFSQLLACTLIYIAMPLLFIGVGCLLLKTPPKEEFIELFRALAGGYPLCVCEFSICFCFFTNLGANWAGVLSAMFVSWGLPYIFNIVGYKFPIFTVLHKWSPANMVEFQLDSHGVRYAFWDTASGMAHCYLSGIIGTLLFVAIGVYWLNKREIR